MYLVGGPVFRLKYVILFGSLCCTWPCRAGSCLATCPHVQAEKAALAEWKSRITSKCHHGFAGITWNQIKSCNKLNLCFIWRYHYSIWWYFMCTSNFGIDVLNENLQTSTISQITCYDKTSLSFFFSWIPAPHQPSPYWDVAFTDENRGVRVQCFPWLLRCWSSSDFLVIAHGVIHGGHHQFVAPLFLCLGGPSIGLDHDRCQSVGHIITIPLKTSVYLCWILLHLADCIP